MAPFLLCGPLATVPVARVQVCQPAMGLAVVPTSVCSDEGCVYGVDIVWSMTMPSITVALSPTPFPPPPPHSPD